MFIVHLSRWIARSCSSAIAGRPSPRVRNSFMFISGQSSTAAITAKLNSITPSLKESGASRPVRQSAGPSGSSKPPGGSSAREEVVFIGSKQTSNSRGDTMAAYREMVDCKKGSESGASKRGSTVRNPVSRQGGPGESHVGLKVRLFGIRCVTVRNPKLSLIFNGGMEATAPLPFPYFRTRPGAPREVCRIRTIR